MNILVSVLCIALVGSSGFVSLEANLKSGNKSSYIFDGKIIKTDSLTVALESQNQPPNRNEDNELDPVPPA